jgi:hypothetical protein
MANSKQILVRVSPQVARALMQIVAQGGDSDLFVDRSCRFALAIQAREQGQASQGQGQGLHLVKLDKLDKPDGHDDGSDNT